MGTEKTDATREAFGKSNYAWSLRRSKSSRVQAEIIILRRSDIPPGLNSISDRIWHPENGGNWTGRNKTSRLPVFLCVILKFFFLSASINWGMSLLTVAPFCLPLTGDPFAEVLNVTDGTLLGGWHPHGLTSMLVLGEFLVSHCHQCIRNRCIFYQLYIIKD